MLASFAAAPSPASESPARASALTILSDLDGTLLPRPYPTASGTVAHPNLSEGPCFRPLVRLLDLGCTIVGVTGSRLVTHKHRFFDELPLVHRKAGKVLMAVQTGTCLYRGSREDGSPVEDEAFTSYLSSKVASSIPLDAIDILIESGRAGIRRFFADLREDPSLVDANGPLSYLLQCDAESVPVTQDDQQVPRIEVRDGNSAVVFVGVPSSINHQYFSVDPRVADVVDGRPTGRACFDCVPKGLDKSLVVEHLIETGVVSGGGSSCGRYTPSSGDLGGARGDGGRALALGDQPLGNDEGLTRWHRGGEGGGGAGAGEVVDIPFVSVSEAERMVPPHLREAHITSACNAEASARLLNAIADMIEAHQGGAGGEGKQQAWDAQPPPLRLDTEAVVALTRRLNGR